MDVVVAIPVLGRPERAAPLIESLLGSVAVVPLRPVFVCSPGDDAQIAACIAAVGGQSVIEMNDPPGHGDYAKKINLVVSHFTEPWVFTGADDLCFCHGWADRALEHAAYTGKSVIGTNDLGNRRVVAGNHSTHSLVRRSYIDEHGTIDEPGKLYHEGYWHNFCDDELVHTAKARGEWASCRGSWVEHMHPDWQKGDWDDTYTLGKARMNDDAQLFQERKPLWEALYAGGRRR